MFTIRTLMNSKVRSNAGCWTCRVRRKKCDENHPVCDGCRALEITCYFGEDKPAWMDGGPRQKEMAEKIKQQVKKQASYRRDRRYMEQLESNTREIRLDDTSPAAALSPAGAKEQPFARRELKDLTPPASDTMCPSSCAPTPPREPEHFGLVPSRSDQDNHIIMVYLDYVFPYLFPYYRPPILSGGRGWILNAIQSHKAVYHSVVSISTWFFGILTFQSEHGDHGAIRDGEQPHACKSLTDRTMQVQLEMGLRELQTEVRRISARDKSEVGRHERLTVLQSILQMVIFEVAVANEGHWRMHLDAAVAVFQQIVPEPEAWCMALVDLADSYWPASFGNGLRMWHPPQAALRFFAANLLLMDVMASMALERVPRLQSYHESLVPRPMVGSSDESDGSCNKICMSQFVGLDNAALHLFGHVATLAAWKKEQKAAGTLDKDDLLLRGNTLATDIQCYIAELDSVIQGISQDPFSNVTSVAVADHLLDWHAKVSGQSNLGEPLLLAYYNRVWLRTALAYLHTVLHGWDPRDPFLRDFSTSIAAELDTLPKPTCLRNMAFPYCVAGCLAVGEDERQLFRSFAPRLGALRIFGTLGQATEIMEAVWKKEDIVAEDWDVGCCLRVLGHCSLLM